MSEFEKLENVIAWLKESVLKEFQRELYFIIEFSYDQLNFKCILS